ncbi:D-aminoacyl-tRNA deacylase [Hydrogenobacter thermophilus]|uniref:D-aminoacyl-tRNA deacylase n=1 Tax=Hydrogenobacter thermophilus TaxID=940 RepID=UPI0030F5E873
MRAILQRVKSSWVLVNGTEVGRIGIGVNVLLGVGKTDDENDARKLADKILNLRIFEDEEGKFQYSLLDVKGSALIIPQFTLYANTKKGRRPSFEEAESPERAEELYNYFVEIMSMRVPVSTGKFGAMMEVYILNWGPVTIFLDSKEL